MHGEWVLAYAEDADGKEIELQTHRLILDQNSDSYLSIRMNIVNDFIYQYRLDHELRLGEITWATLTKGDGTSLESDSSMAHMKLEEDILQRLLENVNRIRVQNEFKIQLIGEYYKATLVST